MACQSIPGLASFALDVFSEALLIIKFTEPDLFEIEFANSAFERLCGIAREDLNLESQMFLIDEKRFLEVVEGTFACNAKPTRSSFLLKKNKNQSRAINILSIKQQSAYPCKINHS
jgi:hypothetical protein